jgi:hypothetical protein
MTPPCPNCSQDMVSTDLFNLFVCRPCRQIVQFFGAGVEAQSGAAHGPAIIAPVRPLSSTTAAKLPRSAAARPTRSSQRRSG